MSEKAKFHKLTQPIRFRRTKLFFKSIGRTYEVGTEKLRYFCNYVLYKLKVLDRYSYRDRIRNPVSIPYEHKSLVAEGDTIRGRVVIGLYRETHYDIDYFYRKKKDSKMKITLSLRDFTEHKFFAESHLEDVELKIAGDWHKTNFLPTFKMATLPPLKTVADTPELEPTEVEYKTITFHLNSILGLRHLSFLGVMPSDCIQEFLSERMFKYYYHKAVDEFTTKLKSMSVYDLIEG